MQKVTYKEAAEILGVEYITIKHAAMRGKLTRCSIPINQAMLLKDQVDLFKDKRNISLNNLTTEEKFIWEECQKIAQDQELLAIATNQTPSTESIAMKMAQEAGKTGAKAALHKINTVLKSVLIENNLRVPQELEDILETINP